MVSWVSRGEGVNPILDTGVVVHRILIHYQLPLVTFGQTDVKNELSDPKPLEMTSILHFSIHFHSSFPVNALFCQNRVKLVWWSSATLKTYDLIPVLYFKVSWSYVFLLGNTVVTLWSIYFEKWAQWPWSPSKWHPYRIFQISSLKACFTPSALVLKI